MTLRAFLEKTNSKGELHRHWKNRYEAARAANETEEPFEAWACAQRGKGESLVAAMYLSRYNDEFYGQWVVMNVPFWDIAELWRQELDLIPDEHFYQALALLHRPDHWRNEACVRADLELRAFREHHIKNIWFMLRANAELIDKYWSGELDKDAVQIRSDIDGVDFEMAPEQQRITDELVASVEEGLQLRQGCENRWKGEHVNVPEVPVDPFAWHTNVNARRSAFAVLGPAGSGKTTSIKEAVKRDERYKAMALADEDLEGVQAALREMGWSE